MHTELKYKKSKSRSVACERRIDLLRIGLQILLSWTRWDETLSFFMLFCRHCGLWLMFRQHQTQEKVSAEMLVRVVLHFESTLCWITLNLWLIFSALINWVRISSNVVGGVVGGAVSLGPHFSKLKGQTSKPQMIITTPDVFTAFQRGDWVYYLQLCCSCLMSLLFVRSQNFHCSFLGSLFVKKCHIIHGARRSFHVEIKPLKCQNCGR